MTMWKDENCRWNRRNIDIRNKAFQKMQKRNKGIVGTVNEVIVSLANAFGQVMYGDDWEESK